MSSSGQRASSTKLSTSAVFRTLICCRAQWAGERALKANNINDFTPVDPWMAASEREIGVSDKTIEECFCRAGPRSVATAPARNVPLHRSQWTLSPEVCCGVFPCHCVHVSQGSRCSSALPLNLPSPPPFQFATPTTASCRPLVEVTWSLRNALLEVALKRFLLCAPL